MTLASASRDHTIKLWSPASGQHARTLAGHNNAVLMVVFDPKGLILASGSDDHTVRLWDAESGKLLRTLEGHTGPVEVVAFSTDGHVLASKGGDGTVRLWSCETWETVAVVPEPTQSGWWIPSLAIHPSLPLLATAGSNANTPEEDRCKFIHLWEFDLGVLLGKQHGMTRYKRAAHHTTAKIVLVGDHSVGKSGLGYRLVHGKFVEQASSHGQQFWVLPQLGKRRSDGTDCEAILWDLAGQPDYRLIHALFLDDADLALVVFDASDIRDPLHGIGFWLSQLKTGETSRGCSGEREDAGSRKSCRALLVGAQADRGTPALTQAELEEFCQRHGLGGYVSTSARDGTGLDELLQRMQNLIHWEGKPATVTTLTFKRIKDFVLGLKANPVRGRVVVDAAELRRQLQATDAHWQFTDAEMLTAVGHLENYGYVKRLRTSKGEQRILLAPELLNNLAASFVLEARRNPKGLGSLEEERLFAGEYPFHELAGVSHEDRDVLLDSTVLLFLEHNVCFRETDPLNSQSYLVFPELINLKKPVVEDEKANEDGMAYTVSGAVENVYASLVVLLGYTQTFTRTDQWRNQARYEVGNGLVCGFRQDGERDGELDFVLYFCRTVGRPVRTLFQGLFESFLARRNLTVVRCEPVSCSKGHLVNRSVVREQRASAADSAFCAKCGERVTLPKADEPLQLTRQIQAEVESQRWAATQRSHFEQAVFRIQAYVQDQDIKAPECFISYAWGVPEHERWVEKSLATDLQKAGLKVVLDRWENAKIGSSVPRFVERIAKCERIVVVGTPRYLEKYENGQPMSAFVLAAEGDLIGKRMIGS